MMKKRETLIAHQAPRPIGPYSVGIRSGDLVFTAGMLGIDPATGKLVEGGIEAQTRQAILNLKAILEAGGSALPLVVKTTVFLRDMAEFPKMNATYGEFFPADPPARTTVEVARLPMGARVEIEAVAAVATGRGD
ncbi:MAG: Rid family detoxifying hydrolase [Chloroflexota bacterium]